MRINTKQKLLKTTKQIFAQHGYQGLSIRNLAKQANISPSVIYHHFNDKDNLLKQMFNYYRKNLGKIRNQLPIQTNPIKMMKQRVEFQLDNAETIVAILKYYLHYRNKFSQNPTGFIPKTAYRHIEEVLEIGTQKNIFNSPDIEADAKVITHAINGFVLEYYPLEITKTEKTQLINKITDFIIRGLQTKNTQKGGE